MSFYIRKWRFIYFLPTAPTSFPRYSVEQEINSVWPNELKKASNWATRDVVSFKN